jgi:small neutral amino acid transporter SnatA (MarC family)
VIVLLIGLQMLFNKSEHKHSSAELEDAQSRASIAVVPLAIPVVAGPGTIATVFGGSPTTPLRAEQSRDLGRHRSPRGALWTLV